MPFLSKLRSDIDEIKANLDKIKDEVEAYILTSEKELSLLPDNPPNNYESRERVRRAERRVENSKECSQAIKHLRETNFSEVDDLLREYDGVIFLGSRQIHLLHRPAIKPILTLRTFLGSR